MSKDKIYTNEALDYVKSHIDSFDGTAKQNLLALTKFVERRLACDKQEKRKCKAVKRQVKLYEKARLDVINTAEDFMKGLPKHDLKRLMSDSAHIKEVKTYGEDVNNSQHYTNDWCTREYIIELHSKEVDGYVRICVPAEGDILKAGVDNVYEEPILRVEIFRNNNMIDSYVIQWFMYDAFLPFMNARKVLRELYNKEPSFTEPSKAFITLLNILVSRYPKTMYI